MVITDEEKRREIAQYDKLSWTNMLRCHALKQTKQQARNTCSASAHLLSTWRRTYICYNWRVDKASVMAQASMYGSIAPATWSLMMARGIGSAWTTLHLRYEREVGEILGIPEETTQTALLPIAYYIGDDFKPAPRRLASEITYWDTWGETR